MKTIKTLLLAGLISLAPIKKAQAQDPVQIKGNPALEWFADGVGNQNGKLEALERDYMEKKFEESDVLYVCTATPDYFYKSGMKKLHTSHTEAWNYWSENPVRGPQAIVAFNKVGGIVEAHNVAGKLGGFSESMIFKLPEIDYKTKMEERLEYFYKDK